VEGGEKLRGQKFLAQRGGLSWTKQKVRAGKRVKKWHEESRPELEKPPRERGERGNLKG